MIPADCSVDSIITCYIWSQIEPTTAIVCACLTTYGPLFAGPNLDFLVTLGSWANRRSGSDRNKEWSNITSDGDVPMIRPARRVTSEKELRRFESLNRRAVSGGLHVIEIGLGPSGLRGSEPEGFVFGCGFGASDICVRKEVSVV